MGDAVEASQRLLQQQDRRAARTDRQPHAGRGQARSRRQEVEAWLFPREFTKLVSCHAVPRHWRELYAITTYLYLRPGEAFALDWSAVQLHESYVQVAVSLDFATSASKTTKTKTGRRVPIHPSLRPLRQRVGDEADGRGV